MDDYTRLRESLGAEFPEVWRLQNRDIARYTELIDKHCRHPTKREFLLSVLSVFHSWYPPFGLVVMPPTEGDVGPGEFIEKHSRERAAHFKAMLKNKAEKTTGQKYEMGLCFSFHMMLNPSFDIGVQTVDPKCIGYKFMSAPAVIWCNGRMGAKGIVIVVELDDRDSAFADTTEGNMGSWMYSAQRDRLLVDDGWSVRRYNEREIKDDAMDCAEDLVCHLIDSAISFESGQQKQVAAAPSVPRGRAPSADHAQKCSKPN